MRDTAQMMASICEPCKAGSTGGYFRNESSTLSLAFAHGRRKSCDEPHPLIGMVVASEFTSLELVGRFAGQYPLTWFAVTQAS